jgi:stearoyl-CoA desaturase (delta-9 desaturase)
MLALDRGDASSDKNLAGKPMPGDFRIERETIESRPAVTSLHASSAKALDRPLAVTRRVAWRYAAPIVALHMLALGVCLPWLFSWTGVVLMVLGVEVFGGLGINIAYHRLLTHRSFRCPLWLERCFVFFALCCMEDAPASWVATHRQHHHDSDTQRDPHSPLVNFLWSHVGWLLVENRDVRSLSAYDRYARDVLRDPFYLRLERSLLPTWIYLAHAAAYFLAACGVGLAVGSGPSSGLQFGLSVLVWGVAARTVCVWHISWSVNSLTHLCGYRSYETADNSRNSLLVALLSNGEGWHNNHHADPSSASNAHRWWEIDLIYAVIRGLELSGLATDVIRPRRRRTPRVEAIRIDQMQVNQRRRRAA